MFPFWVKPAIILVLLAVIAFGLNRLLDHEQQLGYDKAMAEVTKKENESLKFALAEITRLNQKVEDAQNAAKEREAESQKYLTRIGVLDSKLRDSQRTIGDAAATASTDALRKAIPAFNTLFADCRGKFEAMGRAASEHYSDVVTLEQAWPVNQ